MAQAEMDITEYWSAFLRRKWYLIVPTIICAGVAMYIAYNLPAIYRSTTLILVEQQRISSAYVTPTDATPFEQRLSTIKQQVMSRTNLEKIIDDFKLYQDDANNSMRGSFKKIFKFLERLGLVAALNPTKEEAIEAMRSDIRVDVIGGGRNGGGEAFRISYTGKDPYLIMQVTNTLASLFIEENLKIKEQYAEGTTEFLIKELESAKQELEVQEAALSKFKQRRMGALPGQLEPNLRTLDRLQIELQSINESLKNAEDRKAFLEEQLNLATSVAPASGRGETVTTYNSLDEELAALQKKLAELLSYYTENYPDVIFIKNRIQSIEEELAKTDKVSDKPESAKTGDNITSEKTDNIPSSARGSKIYMELQAIKMRISMLKGRETKVLQRIKVFEKRVEATPTNEQKLIDLNRDYGITLQNYQTLLEKKLNARLAENLEKKQKGARFRVVDPANLPEKPFKPNRPKIISAGAAAGAGIGFGFIFLLEFLNPAFRRPEDFAGVLDEPVLAVIPGFIAKAGKESKKKLRVISGSKKQRA